MSALVLAFSAALGNNGLTRLLAFFGSESLVIYVMHPLAIILLDKLGIHHRIGAGAGVVLYYAACLGLPLAAGAGWRAGKRFLTKSQ